MLPSVEKIVCYYCRNVIVDPMMSWGKCKICSDNLIEVWTSFNDEYSPTIVTEIIWSEDNHNFKWLWYEFPQGKQGSFNKDNRNILKLHHIPSGTPRQIIEKLKLYTTFS